MSDLPSYEAVSVRRYRGEREFVEDDFLLNEKPVSIVYNGYPHVVIMCTPKDLEDFIYGFSFTEGIVNRAEEILSIHLDLRENGVVAEVEILPECIIRLESRKRQMSARTGCGICGLDSLDQVVRPLKKIETKSEVEINSINEALKVASDFQALNQKTGGAHGAFLCDKMGQILLVREDVGRHVAMDKLIGALIRAGIPTHDKFCLITSRASFEMVQKAICAKFNLLVAISAPTLMAVNLAKEHQIKLAAFSRVNKINVYSS